MISDHDRYLARELYAGGKGLMPCQIARKLELKTSEVREALGLNADYGRRWSEKEKAACRDLIAEAVRTGGKPDKDVISQQLEAKFGRTFHPVRVASYIRVHTRREREAYTPRDRDRFMRIMQAYPLNTVDGNIRVFQRCTGKTLKASTARSWASRLAKQAAQ